MKKINKRGELGIDEAHPAASSALLAIASLSSKDFAMWQESFSSCAIEGNRLAEVCAETLNRIRESKPVGDRFVLGLAWIIFHSDFGKKRKGRGWKS